MALTQQDLVEVDVVPRASVAQVELQNVSGVTNQSSHQRITAAQLLKGSSGLKSPAALQMERDILPIKAPPRQSGSETKYDPERGKGNAELAITFSHSPWKV